MTKQELLLQTFKSKFDLSQYKKFIVEFFNDAKLLNGEKRNDYWNWNEYSFYINGYYHVADHLDDKRNKIAIFAVELKKGKSLEKARSKQRNFIADRIKVMGYDGAIAAFYSEDEKENRWRLSFVRLDYELLKGKIKTNFTPAKRYSYLLGVDEPCHTAMQQLYPILEEEKFNPSIDKLEEAFSVEKVTKQFFEKYKEKYIELYEYLTQNDTFRDEAIRCVKSDNDDDISKFTEQFAKKLMGQVVFMYFLQKKGWLGVTAFPPKITEKEYKNAFFSCNDEHKQILKQLYVLGEDGEYIRQARIINALSDDDQTYFAARIKGMAWETGPKDFVRILFKEAIKHNRNYFEYYLEPLFYEALNEKREANNFYARLHCRIPFLNGGLFEPLDGYDWRHNNFSIPNEIFSNASVKGEREADGILDIFDRYNFTMNEDEPLEKEVAVDPEMLGKIFENLLDVKDRKSKGAFYTPREIVHYMCQESLINYIVNTVGTPYEDTKDFILYGEIMKDEDCSREVKSGAVDMLMPDSIYKNLKAIDDALADVRVADPAVGSGAFPMGMVNEIVKARENITAYFAREATAAQARQLWNYTRHPYMLKKDAMKNSIFAVDIEPSAVDITKLRLWLSLVVEFDINSENEEFRTPPTLPNLECNILCGNSLIDEFEGIKLFNDSLLTGASNNGNWMADLFQDQVDKTLEKLIEKQRELFYANNHDDKYRLKHEIDVLQQQVIFSSCTMTDDVKERVTSAFAMPSKPFILWKLAFAKVFKDKGGFDIVIGNPPYGAKFSAKEKVLLAKKYPTVPDYESADYFLDKSHELLNNVGYVNYIIPNMFLANQYAKKYRITLLNMWGFYRIYNLSQCSVFESASVRNVIVVFSKNTSDYGSYVNMDVVQSAVQIKKSIVLSLAFLQENIDNWLNLLDFDTTTANFIKKIREKSVELNTLCEVSQGLIPYDKYRGHSEEIIKNKIWNANYKKDETYKRELQGKDVLRYSLQWNGEDWLSYGEWLAAPRKKEFFTEKRLLIREITNPRILATYTDEEYYNTPSIINCINFNEVHPFYVLGIVNSLLMSFYHKKSSPKANKGLFPKILVSDVRKMPICINENYEDKIVEIVKNLLTFYDERLDKELDEIIYKLYDLTPEEISLVEEAVK